MNVADGETLATTRRTSAEAPSAPAHAEPAGTGCRQGPHPHRHTAHGDDGPWPIQQLGPYLQWRLEDLTGVRVQIALEPHDAGRAADAGRRARTALAAARALGRPVQVRYRSDGRPELAGGRRISASHGHGTTLCIVADGVAGCDVETVTVRPRAEWESLLGRHYRLAELIAQDAPEPVGAAATGVWSALECLRKAGQPADAPLTATPRHGAWTVFASGTLRIAALLTTLQNVPGQVVFAVLVEGRPTEGRAVEGRPAAMRDHLMGDHRAMQAQGRTA